MVDSPAGGGWVESCASQVLPVGITTPEAPAPLLALPGGLAADATSLAGALLGFHARATTAAGTPVLVDCQPPSGAVFPLGVTNVLCTAVDPSTQAVGLGTFPVTVIDGPPVVNVPAAGIIAEADSALGALVSYDVTATDAVDGPLPVDCTPAASPGSPVLFPLDQDTTVICQASDGAHETTQSFVVQVRDTTPPTLCDLADVTIDASGPAGTIVTFATCAFDRVDGPVAVVCDHPSGSLFSLGATAITCSATDRHGNHAQKSFTVQVAISWSNLLAPIDLLAPAVFLRGLPITVQFSLTGPSARITNLGARLFIAPVDGAGQLGTERPAVALAPGVTNLFRFVPLVNRYLLSVSTRGMSAGIWQLRVDLGDGLRHTARIRLL